MVVKIQLGSKKFYLPILGSLKKGTNLNDIQEQLKISKQKLNYYLRQLKQKGLIIQKGRGWYEVVKQSKNSTKYESLLTKDSVRGHAYVWTIKFPQEIEGWENRIKTLEKKKINFKLVGALKSTPRIKALGRKVWLCNNHLRIFDKKHQSYYGENAIKSRGIAFQEIKLIVGVLNRKLGTSLKPSDIYFKKEHYALIKNDLAIEENRKGNIWRINDEDGEWLLIDDSLGRGGELESVGKKALKVNVPMQKWWNDQKQSKFKVTPSFVLNTMNGIQQNQLVFDNNMKSHLNVLEKLGNAVDSLTKEIRELKTARESA